MPDLIETKIGKYKGVEILFTEAPTTFGNRLIKFNFPGSDKQAIERQGMIPRTFELTIVLPHQDYYTVKEATMRVLEDGKEGVLTHPTFGDIEKVINGECKIDERRNSLGRALVKVIFEVNDALGVPQESANLPSQVQTAGEAVAAQLTTDVAERYSVNPNSPGNFTDALKNVNKISQAFGDAADFATPLAENVSDYRRAVSTLASSAGALVKSPADLAESVAGLFESLDTLFATPESAFGAFKALFSFGDDDPVVVPTTTGLAERKRNRDALRTDMRTQALSFGYTNAALSTYSTTEDIDAAQSDLEAQYASIRDDETISNEASEALDRQRVAAIAALDLVRVDTRMIITVETPIIPLSVLVYSYYGSTDLVETIADLNNIKLNAFVEGEIRILTDA